MKKWIVLSIILLNFIVYLKQTAYTTYKGAFKGFDPPYKIELETIESGPYGVQGKTKDGKIIIIPWDAISWIEENK